MENVSEVEATGIADQIQSMRDSQERILEQIRRVIVGQEEVVEQVLVAIFAGGHSLLTGLPGLAKTLLVQTTADALGLSFSRIQFTPDLMPADITGTEIIEEDKDTGRRSLEFVKGPIFANLILADEINRTPPKTQAALLEAMQEKSVTVAGNTFSLEPPFFVLATQNPIELEGTYTLPEAQLDRFMFNILIDYLNEEDEISVVQGTTGDTLATVEPVITREEMVGFQTLVRQIPAATDVTRYAVRLARTSRPIDPDASETTRKYVSYGASPRAAQFMILGGKARAIMRGRFSVSCADVQAMARPVLRHRILTNFHAESEGITTDQVVEEILNSTEMPKSGL